MNDFLSIVSSLSPDLDAVLTRLSLLRLTSRREVRTCAVSA